MQTASQSATVGCTTSVVVEWRAVGDVTEDVHGAEPGVELEGFEVEEGGVVGGVNDEGLRVHSTAVG